MKVWAATVFSLVLAASGRNVVAASGVHPALLFHAPLDNSAEAVVAVGSPEPLEAKGLKWASGRGGAAALHAVSGLHLRYAATGNLPRQRGTVALWTRREWGDEDAIAAESAATAAPPVWRTLFATPMPADRGRPRVGTGALWLWWWGDRLRADQSDAKDRYRAWDGFPADGRWHHIAFTWTPSRTDLFVDGVRREGMRDSDSPLREALTEASAIAPDRSGIASFSIGSINGEEAAASLISDFRIYGDALDEDQVHALFLETGGRDEADAHPDWTAILNGPTGRWHNPYETPPNPTVPPGVPVGMELVDEIRLDHFPPPDRFRQSGSTTCKATSSGMPYLEAGSAKGDRFAVRFRLDSDAALHVFEIDVPDDAVRTVDLLVQPCKGDPDYATQVGLLLGGDMPNSGRILTHRVLHWTQPGAAARDVALVAMTARDGEPAAVAAVRAYRVASGGLPECPPPIHAPSAAANRDAKTWGRSIALWYEDPAINLEFGVEPRVAASPVGFAEVLRRLAATMKFTGQDTLFYPGAWYHGLIGGKRYNPRRHPPDWRVGLYEVFDREGLSFVPTVNVNTMPLPADCPPVTAAAMEDDSLHDSPIAIHASGEPNHGGWHDTPPDFCFLHPAVQCHLEGIFDSLLDEGASHPSFGGIAFHLTRHGLAWWGDEESGYNEYIVKAFCRDAGFALPAVPAESLRGKAYAEWVRADPARHETWIQWRCDRVTEFYARLAAKLRERRPDAKLILSVFVPPDVRHPEFGRPDFQNRANRRCGLDGPALSAAIPNLVLCQTDVPADGRWAEAWRFPSAASRETRRKINATAGFWELLRGAAWPWAGQHDRYWESAIGVQSPSLSCEWFHECRWRVSTLNPGGEDALRAFVLPLRYGDVLGMSKGGYLIGTYGMEPHLARFARAFRSLPAVRMDEFFRQGSIVARKAEVEGRTYGYIVNTDATPTTVDIADLPDGTTDLVSGQPLTGTALHLEPYEFKAFSK